MATANGGFFLTTILVKLLDKRTPSTAFIATPGPIFVDGTTLLTGILNVRFSHGLIIASFTFCYSQPIAVAVEIVGWSFAKEIVDEHFVCKHANDALVMVNDEKEIGVGAEKCGKGLVEGIIFAQIADFGVEDVGYTTRFFDFEIIERSGMNETDDFARFVEYGKVLEARAIESVERERAKDLVGLDVGDGGFWQHDFGDLDSGKVHNCGDDMTFARTQNRTWSTP